MELFQELNQKFQTLDRFRDIPNMGTMVSNRKPGEGGRGMDGQFKPVTYIWCGTHNVGFCKRTVVQLKRSRDSPVAGMDG